LTGFFLTLAGAAPALGQAALVGDAEAGAELYSIECRLAIELMFSKDARKAGEAMKLIGRYKAWLTGQLVTRTFD
jgi:hypothetical protein